MLEKEGAFTLYVNPSARQCNEVLLKISAFYASWTRSFENLLSVTEWLYRAAPECICDHGAGNMEFTENPIVTYMFPDQFLAWRVAGKAYALATRLRKKAAFMLNIMFWI